MDIKLSKSWQQVLQQEFHKPYFHSLIAFIEKEFATNTCYPERDAIFAAFDHCSFEKTKVVIIGQDPYHGYNQANGLCFSVNDGMPHPPSLSNIFKEIETDIGKPYPISGNLAHWADQGVLLLNSILTVKANQAASHQKKGWEKFTDQVIKTISNEKKEVLFLLWGGYAKKKIKLIDTSKHHVLNSGHPSPLSANRGYWFDNKHFSKTNTILLALKKPTINW